MKRYASVRFGAVLVPGERETVARVVRSSGATATSWHATTARTYLTLEADAAAAARVALALTGAVVDTPALAVLRILPDAARMRERLVAALGGSGRPGGVRDLYPDRDALVVEVDTARTALAFIIALIDAELVTAPGRTIEPLVLLDDAALAALAGDVLGVHDMDASRLIEPYVEAILAECGA